MNRIVRRALIPAVAAGFALATLAAPAQAVPVPGPNESITFTYYSTAAKTTVVGGWSYGSCGEPFQWGKKTGYYTLVHIYC